MRAFSWLRNLSQPQYQYLSEVDKLDPGTRILWWHEPDLKNWYQAKRMITVVLCHNPDPNELAIASATLRCMLFGGWR